MTIESTVIGYKSRSSPIELQKKTISTPLEPDFVVVKTAFAALNPVDAKLKAFSFFGGRVALLDFSGKIFQVAKNLEGQFTKGERVSGALLDFGDAKSFVGSYALVNVKRHALIKTPENLSDELAAALPVVLQTALTILAKTKLNPDSRVLVLGGATSVGSLVIQLLKQVYHVKDIVVTCSSRSAAYVKELGAVEVVDYSSGNLSKKLVQTAANGKYQAILDTAGGNAALKVWKKLLCPAKDGSSYVTIAGSAEPSQSYSGILTWELISSIPSVLYYMLFGKWVGINYTMLSSQDADLFRQSEATLENKDIRVRVDSVFPLAEAAKAWDKMDKYGAKGKVLVEF